jgi:DNA-binding transcriptional ArsR family regulator
MNTQVTLVDEAPAAHAALSPLRLRILRTLELPASATELAQRLDLTRQKVNYHLGVLEDHGLVEVVAERQRRGFVERVFRRKGNVVLAPDLVEPHRRGTRDEMSAEALVAAASDAIRTVGSLSAEAQAKGMQLATATMVTELVFRSPAEVTAFLEGVADLAAHFDAGGEAEGHRMRVAVLSHSVHPTNEQGVDRG